MIEPAKVSQITQLFDEFIAGYVAQDEDARIPPFTPPARAKGEANFAAALAAQARGEDITDLVLLKLLPYSDNAGNRKSGAWVHYAPSIVGDLRKWYEAKQWINRKIGRRWLRLCWSSRSAVSITARRCRRLAAIFAALPYVKGFQDGTLTPILSALRPNEFILINNKSRRLVNYLAGTKLPHDLLDYPALNEAGLGVVAELDDLLRSAGLDLLTSDVFDIWPLASGVEEIPI